MTALPSRECALPGTPLAFASAGLDACVHCGFCLQACPTYVNLEDENDSPRGRIVLMRRLLEGDLPLDDPDVGTHLDRCLGCRACESACPSGVPYGHLLEASRATMLSARPTPFVGSIILNIFRHSTLLSVALFGARVFRASGVPSLLARMLPRRLAFPMAMLASTKPSAQMRHSGSHKREVRLDKTLTAYTPEPQPDNVAEGPSRATELARATTDFVALNDSNVLNPKVALLEGCVMRGLFAHTNNATRRVLTRNGYDVVTVNGQNCCGALHAHAGKLDTARELARANIAAFEANDMDVIAINSAGCGAMVKDYGHLLQDDPAWSERARAISAKARDISELLAHPVPASPLPSTLRVTYDAPCHLMHAQRITREPLTMLNAIAGLALVPLVDNDQCCGSAGIYNLIEPETSDAVLAPKLARIAESRANIVATGNPGCLMQIGAGLMLSGSPARAVHPIDLLDAAYGHSEA